MDARSGRRLTDRELRALSTAELLELIQADIQELDRMARQRRQRRGEQKPARRRTREPDLEDAAPEEVPEPLTLHAVTCCNHHMGDFPAMAQVRCPFCGQWHRAGDFPKVG